MLNKSLSAGKFGLFINLKSNLISKESNRYVSFKDLITNSGERNKIE